MALTKSQLEIVAGNSREIKDNLEQKFKHKHKSKMTRPFAMLVRVTRRNTIAMNIRLLKLKQDSTDTSKVVSEVFTQFNPLMAKVLRFELLEFAKKQKLKEEEIFHSFLRPKLRTNSLSS